VNWKFPCFVGRGILLAQNARGESRVFDLGNQDYVRLADFSFTEKRFRGRFTLNAPKRL